MKKSIIVLLCLNSIYAGAQLKVNSNGSVVVGTPATEGAPLNVGGDITASTYEIKIGTTTTGYLGRGGTITSNWGYTPDIMTLTYDKNDFAIGGFKTGTGTWNGASLFISATTAKVGIGNMDPQFPLEVTGDIRISGDYLKTSDQRLKKNITPLEHALQNISKLNGKRYEKDVYFNSPERKATATSPTAVEYGVIAQEVQKVFPELVKIDTKGILSVNYIGLIPVLIEAMKEQQGQIAEKTGALDALSRQTELLQKIVAAQETEIATMKTQLNTIVNTCCTQARQENDGSATHATGVKLYQNSPNPFSAKTEISYFLPQNVAAASLYIFNLQGSLLKEIPVTARGKGSVIIDGAALSPGMYIYSLIVNGQEADSKRMVLTK
ncbi:tail fiber domain-containing protein [Taibaiella chishuiensis]|uniref:Putative secreted protein (Por secretion system target) n=1 Tax=Taibaiella chishuiensis TaxID=1434707 RepID=A0A2P8D5N2_9BACT|nr:tail fiber domain-containing protein [Taibaiella chishuiensis]PSK92534.1 putative secreted protein (Por secretion system target) [Taibaiella chishuiensis]